MKTVMTFLAGACSTLSAILFIESQGDPVGTNLACANAFAAIMCSLYVIFKGKTDHVQK